MLNKMAVDIFAANVEKGFYEDNNAVRDCLKLNGNPEMVKIFDKAVVGQRLMLITSEVAEALEGNRKDKKADIETFLTETTRQPYKEGAAKSFEQAFIDNIKDTPEDELADALIRILDYCGAYQIDIDFHVQKKLEYNALRPYKHGKTY